MAHPIELRERAVAYAKKTTVREAAEVFQLSPTSIQTWKKIMEERGTLKPRTSPGRTRLLTPQQEQRLVELTEDFPDWTQNDYASVLSDEFGFTVNQTLVSKTLRRNNITIKKTVAR